MDRLLSERLWGRAWWVGRTEGPSGYPVPKDALWGWESGEGDTWDKQSISHLLGPALGSQCALGDSSNDLSDSAPFTLSPVLPLATHTHTHTHTYSAQPQTQAPH